MITIVDYGMGNLGSIQNMLRKMGFESIISSDSQIILQAQKLILPGVGAFDKAMINLQNLDLIIPLNQKVLKQSTPILGICLGMQLLAENSEEGVLPGLGWIKANVKRFQSNGWPALKIPHMGWNVVVATAKNNLFSKMPYNEMRFYFVHSYYFECQEEGIQIGSTKYGKNFTSAINKKNIWGVQFHPEKSHKFGMQLLKNFALL